MPHDVNSTPPGAVPKGEQLRRVREAAEAIFRPSERRAEVAGATAESAPLITEERVPRVLPIQKQQDDIVADPASNAESNVDAASIPKSEYGRIRVLTSYGMTVRQVAALYKTTSATITKITAQAKSGMP